MYSDYTVRLNFNDGTNDYDLPYVQNVSEPMPGIRANVINGLRADGAIVIPAGKKSINIVVEGVLWTNDGYKDLMSQVDEMKSKITTIPATLTLKYFDPTLSAGGQWVTSWSFAVRRIADITFGKSMRTEKMEYSVDFLITGY
jgi:hypothetical protein